MNPTDEQIRLERLFEYANRIQNIPGNEAWASAVKDALAYVKHGDTTQHKHLEYGMLREGI